MQAPEQRLGRFFENESVVVLAQDRPVGGQIFAALRMAILRMEIEPGALISELEVGRKFAASRTPVREALAELRAAGLVVTSMGRGNFATKLSRPRIEEARFIRDVIELGGLQAVCAEGLAARDHLALDENLARQRAAIDAQDAVGFWTLDDQFHLLLMQATGYDRMGSILEREKAVLDRLRVLSLHRTAEMERRFSEHREILAAVAAQNSVAACALMRTHLNSVMTALADFEARHAAYFEPVT